MTGEAIPRAVTPDSFQRQLDTLNRKMRALAARRTYVALERITPGGQVQEDVSQELTETVKRWLVIEADNIGTGALDAAVITGPLIRTRASGTRVELADDGITSHGTGTLVRPAPQTATPYAVRARLFNMPGEFAGDTDRVPALWFERNPTDGSAYTPPVRPPRVTPSVGSSTAIEMHSGQLAAGDARAWASASSGGATLAANGPLSASGKPSTQVLHSVDPSGGFEILSQTISDAGVVSVDAQVKYTPATGVLDIKAKGGVLINGAAPGSGGGTPAEAPLVITGLSGADQPSKAEDDVAIVWNGAMGDTQMWGGNLAPRYPTRLYVSKAGMYFLTGNVTFSNQGGGMRGVWFRRNGSQRIRGQSNPPPSAAQYAEIDAHNYAFLSAGDYIEIMATVAGAAGPVSIKANEGTAGAVEWKRPA